jgi:hypothetical protein
VLLELLHRPYFGRKYGIPAIKPEYRGATKWLAGRS